MRVFVAFGYTRDELWVKNLVIPMLTNLGIEVLTGEHLPGKPISDEVVRLIQSSDALIGFLLKRVKNPDGGWTSSDYVRREIRIAFDHGKMVTQVVEDGIAPVLLPDDIQRLTYDPSVQAAFLVRLVRHFRDWIRGEVNLQLAPPDLVRELDYEAVRGTAAANPCEYSIFHQNQLESKGRSAVFGVGGSLCVKLIGFLEGRSANVTIDVNGKQWIVLRVPREQVVASLEMARRP